MNFGPIELTERMQQALVADRIQAPTATQLAAFDGILAGDHTVLHAATGTGKTLGYLLPVLQLLRQHPEQRAVVFAPGVELAMQTLRVARAYKDDELSAGAAITTGSRARQKQRITKSTRLVVGTPDRLIPLFREGKLKGVRIVVLDELEPILASREAAFLDELFSRSEPPLQRIVASATLGPRSDAFLERFLPERVHLTPTEAPLKDQIAHHAVRAGPDKTLTLTRFVQEEKSTPAILFVSDAAQRSHLFHHLNDKGITAVTVSRERTKDQRQRSLEAFRRGEAKVLLTTDDAARGLDVPGVPWVLHYDLPRSSQAYVHRAGRTGRSGSTGTSVVFIGDADRNHLARLKKELGLKFDPWQR